MPTSTTTKQKIIVLCDGSWCGSETNTQSNIFLLARMIMAGKDPYISSPYQDNSRGIQACYFPGSGLGGTFIDYVFNGATGSDMGQDCIDVYKYIVKHYTENHEIWMFGLSRGAYTVRCVAGMINNCGILRRDALDTHLVDGLCDEVYKIYRSPYPEDNPKYERMVRFRAHASYAVPTPIKFMGLFDTVGSLGVPKYDAGIGLTFPEFFDQKISAVVEKVYHACAIHDRLWGFESCRALRDAETQKANDEAVKEAKLLNKTDVPQLEIHERWFPGCHYDLGRQRFRFLPNGANWIERKISEILNPLSNVIEPNEVLSDLVLKWMLESINEHQGTEHLAIPDIVAEINKLKSNMVSATRKCGSGDVYNRILDFGPGGKIWQILEEEYSALNRLTLGGHQSFAAQSLRLIVNVLAATRDRRIPDPNAALVLYKAGSEELRDNSIEDLGKVDVKRYPSRTYETFQIYATVING